MADSDSDPTLIGVQPCGCVTYVETEYPPDWSSAEPSLQRLIAKGGHSTLTTWGWARGHLATSCPHEPKGWG